MQRTTFCRKKKCSYCQSLSLVLH